jgi:hypothetical protein
MKIHRVLALSAALAACFAASVDIARAGFMTSVGPGTSIPHNSVDGTPGRTNVDLSNPVLLPAGDYAATFFNYDSGLASDVQPFLASANGAHSYLVLAAGDVRNLPGASENQTIAFGGSNTFTLGATTTVYAGITSSGLNPIPFDSLSAGSYTTDHDQSGSQVFVGQTLASFNAPDNPRRYSFSIDVVPEPSSIVLAAAGIAGLLFAAWRKRTA